MKPKEVEEEEEEEEECGHSQIPIILILCHVYKRLERGRID